MGIPISKYIDIKSKIIAASSGSPDFSALVFATDAMLSTASSSTDTSIKANATAYAAGTAIMLTNYTYDTYFASTTSIYKFAEKYFEYTGAPTRLYVAKWSGTTADASTAYDKVIDSMSNFGTVTFLGATAALTGVASKINSTNYVLVDVGTSSNISTLATAYIDNPNVFLMLGADKTDAWMPCAWYAGVDYNSSDASSTIDYRSFSGVTAQVTTGSDKDKYDALYVNYIGRVQIYGEERQFMQTGVLMDGTDLGVFRDKAWIQALIEIGWFDLVDNQKVPANSTGLALVRAMITSVATKGINNGSILISKTLTEVQTARIAQYTGDSNAAEEVQEAGYYIDAQIQVVDNKYIVQYVLVYAKGDHISKVGGTHYLV